MYLDDIAMPHFAIGPCRGARQCSVEQFVSSHHNITSSQENFDLQNALIEHIWEQSGSNIV